MSGKNVKFSNLASLVALKVCFGLSDNLDAPFKHFSPYFASRQFRGVMRNGMKTRKLYIPFRLYVVSCVVLVLHNNGLLRFPSASRFDQSMIKGNWK